MSEDFEVCLVFKIFQVRSLRLSQSLLLLPSSMHLEENRHGFAKNNKITTLNLKLRDSKLVLSGKWWLLNQSKKSKTTQHDEDIDFGTQKVKVGIKAKCFSLEEKVSLFMVGTQPIIAVFECSSQFFPGIC
ncbi:hypothetical protein VNO77_00627 [Canavalia gladiata]|uniref:Uncharacterized protein n=1 Tax=Canavalia gladiata TaxID=3824 RepID=A0AAN9MUC9_CANGL